jgi:uncharacterized membrane protein YhiD involved in acid resistance
MESFIAHADSNLIFVFNLILSLLAGLAIGIERVSVRTRS